MHRSQPTNLALVLMALTAFAFTGCHQEVSDAPQHPTYDGAAPLTVNGVRPGMTIAEVVGVLGEPVRTTGRTNQPVLNWTQPAQIAVTFDGAGRAEDIFGTSLKVPDRVLVWRGASEAEVVQILGKPDRRAKSTRPTGSGVISIGSEVVGVTLTYRFGDARFEIYLNEDAVSSVRVIKDAAGAR
ncbi:MAG TPA: hypothetical protein DCY13_00450 [Verrucomicrobiales bacterium]|nr:hypothetical protein [Verrucomicrobiales bacterium]